jgi:chloramphenicol O-acetyltransferase type B
MDSLINSPVKHWCEFEFISKTVKNPNIHIKGNYSYYSAYWDQGFERCVVRYLHDKPATPEKPIDQLHIGNFVCFGAECVIMMGGNQLHRPDWISTFLLIPVVSCLLVILSLPMVAGLVVAP